MTIDFDDDDLSGDELLLDHDSELARLEAIEFAAKWGLELPDESGDELIDRKIIKPKAQDNLEPVEYKRKETNKIIATIDCETDPFAYGESVAPFSVGFYDGNVYVDFWGNDCVKQFFDYLATLTANGDEFIIYAHNGGKFDFFFFLEYLDTNINPFIMNSRLVKIYFAGQEFRDSYSIIPQALSKYKKDEIDYALFTKDQREKNKTKILSYQKGDCIYLHELISGFYSRFGDKLTVAGAALPMLHSFHGYQKFSEAKDTRFRSFYYGGRNQCFETGVIKGDWRLYDRNSMYPAVMRDELHPIGNNPELERDITDQTDFACIEAINMGALPMRANNGGLDFTATNGTFFATGHEIRAGLQTGTLKLLKVKHAWRFNEKTTFKEFVEKTYALRLEAKADGNLVLDILHKLEMNSPYGKFALNPRKFKQYCMTIDELPEPLASAKNPDGWKLESISGTIRIWSRPSPRKGGFHNVATAASITGAARANLLVSLSNTKRPIYCDTDSILCEAFDGPLDDKALGGWKLEAQGTYAAIAGKKLYALYDMENGKVGKYERDLAGNIIGFIPDMPVKKASKGVRLMADQIIAVASGHEIEYANPVPTFRFDTRAEFGSQSFISRKIRATG